MPENWSRKALHVDPICGAGIVSQDNHIVILALKKDSRIKLNGL